VTADATLDWPVTKRDFLSGNLESTKMNYVWVRIEWVIEAMKTTRHDFGKRWSDLVSKAVVLPFFVFISQAIAQPVAHVIHISVDGLRPDAITALGPSNLPNFYRLRTQGAFTDNARSDYDYTVTLPNHTTQLTGRGVIGSTGHNWTDNSDPEPGQTLASNKGSYIAGVFDVAHDNGLSTGEYASKSKFSLFATSWNAVNGAPDVIGPDNGRNKIDVYVNDSNTSELVNTLVTNMSNQPLNYAFLHLMDPDAVGHSEGWDITPGSKYSNIIKTMDDRLGAIFALIDGDPELTGRTAIILTADHGGLGTDHSDPTLPADYTVPFYVWGPGVMPGAGLYALNPASRLNPGTGRPNYSAPVQPVRNGEAANVALKLLGLEPVPGSTIGTNQDLALTVPPPEKFQISVTGTNAAIVFTTVSNVLYDIQASTNLYPGSWSNLATNLIGDGDIMTNVDTAPATIPNRFYRLQLHF
jgi:hypothetical protein